MFTGASTTAVSGHGCGRPGSRTHWKRHEHVPPTTLSKPGLKVHRLSLKSFRSMLASASGRQRFCAVTRAPNGSKYTRTGSSSLSCCATQVEPVCADLSTASKRGGAVVGAKRSHSG